MINDIVNICMLFFSMFYYSLSERKREYRLPKKKSLITSDISKETLS